MLLFQPETGDIAVKMANVNKIVSAAHYMDQSGKGSVNMQQWTAIGRRKGFYFHSISNKARSLGIMSYRDQFRRSYGRC